MSFAKPTMRIKRAGSLEPVLISILDVRESKPGHGFDEVLIAVLACAASPMWMPVSWWRARLAQAEVL